MKIGVNSYGRPLEKELEQEIWTRFSSAREPITRAFRDLLPQSARKAIDDRPHGLWSLKSSHSPDLALVKKDNELVLVIELKVDASENLPLLATVRRAMRHRPYLGPSAVAVLQAHELGGQAGDEPHAPEDGCCALHRYEKGTGRSTQVGRAGISQFDAYLTLGWTFDDIRTSNPENVEFLCISPTGASIDDEFAFFGEKWATASWRDFLAALRTHASIAQLHGDLADLVAALELVSS